MRDIIEKLGITPGPWEKDYNGTEHHIKSLGYKGNGTPTVCRYNDDFKHGGRIMVADNLTEEERHANGKLIAVAPEMLEALIDDIESYEFSPGDMFGHSCYVRNKKLFQKITNKSWEEIKDLL